MSKERFFVLLTAIRFDYRNTRMARKEAGDKLRVPTYSNISLITVNLTLHG